MRIRLAVCTILCCAVAVAQQIPNQAFVVNTGDGTASQIELQNYKEIRKIEVGPRLYGVVLSRDGKTLAVGVEDEEKVKFLRTSDFTPVGEVRIGKMFNDRIALEAKAIGADNLSQRLAVPKTGDELQRLSETLNDMIGRLDQAFQRVTQFTADASHELRTPLALMRTTAELALRGPQRVRRLSIKSMAASRFEFGSS